ncbi:hypothetical protein UlMin_006428 [Ulmus minor]
MADLLVAEPPPAAPSNPSHDHFSADSDSLAIPPLDPKFFSSEEGMVSDNFFTDLGLGFDENCDFELNFDDLDDLYLPSENEEFMMPAGFDSPTSSLYPPDMAPAPDQIFLPSSEPMAATNSTSPESDSSTVSGNKDPDVAGYLNCPSSESGSYNGENSHNSGDGNSNVARSLNFDRESSGEHVSSQGSGNCGSGLSEGVNSHSPARSGSSDLSSSVLVEEKVKVEKVGKICMSKRKKESEEGNSESRTPKFRKSSMPGEQAQSPSSLNPLDEEEDKKKARLMRNRESAQLSRQRKKHYVEELEDKVRNMHSTITDLNSKISYIMAENATLRQQLSGGSMCHPPPPPGMYPHPPMAPMGYPWMPCAPYIVKPQGSQVPLVPIPRLKPLPTASASKAKKEGKKTEGKAKKVASISLLGLLFFVLLFGGLVPIVNVNFGGVSNNVSGGSAYLSDGFYDQHQGRVLTANGHYNRSGENVGVSVSGLRYDGFNARHYERGYVKEIPGSDEFVHHGNASEPLLASLYVPRNDKLVKIDGNLIIHSVLASEKTKASLAHSAMKNSQETGLAIPTDLTPALNRGRHAPLCRHATERQKAISSGAIDAMKNHLKSKAADGKLQQWFREGLAGPILSSGMCTEVFQFDVSPASGAIVPASSVSNVSREQRQNSTSLKRGNRRILHKLSIPVPGSNYNITEEQVRRDSRKDNFQGNSSVSSMVVSVLVDPRETGDSDVDSMMKPKSLTRIFVVVLMDSVKYVTYSCVLPRAAPHLVTA